MSRYSTMRTPSSGSHTSNSGCWNIWVKNWVHIFRRRCWSRQQATATKRLPHSTPTSSPYWFPLCHCQSGCRSPLSRFPILSPPPQPARSALQLGSFRCSFGGGSANLPCGELLTCAQTSSCGQPRLSTLLLPHFVFVFAQCLPCLLAIRAGDGCSVWLIGVLINSHTIKKKNRQLVHTIFSESCSCRTKLAIAKMSHKLRGAGTATTRATPGLPRSVHKSASEIAHAVTTLQILKHCHSNHKLGDPSLHSFLRGQSQRSVSKLVALAHRRFAL